MNPFKNISFPKTYTELLQWVSYLWAGTICFPDLQGTFYGVVALLLWGVFRGHLGFSFDYRRCLSAAEERSSVSKAENCIEAPTSFWKSRKTPFYFLLAYVLWMTASIFWSDDIREYFRQFEKLIPLYLLAFIGFMEGIEKHINFNKVLNAFLWGVLMAIGYMVVRMGVDMFVGDTIGKIKTSGIMRFNLFYYLQHRTYMGSILVMAIPLLFYNVRLFNKWEKVPSILMIIFISFFCFTSGARVFFIIIPLVISICAYISWGQAIKWWIQIFLLAIIIVSITSIAMKDKRIRTMYSDINSGSSIENIDSRYELWKSVLDIISEEPIVGYGLGDGESAMIESYKNNELFTAAKLKINAHNQYLQTAVFGGLIGLGLILIFVFLLIHRTLSHKGEYHVFVIVFAVQYFILNLFECFMVRNIGVFPIVLFLFFINQLSNKKNTYNISNGRSSNIIMLLLPILLFLILGAVYLTPTKSHYPSTYIASKFIVVKNKDLPLAVDIPDYTDGFKVTVDQIAKVNNTQHPLNFKYINDELDSANIEMSIWCIIASNKAVNQVSVWLNDGSGYSRSSYDLKNLGTWQKLTISNICSVRNLRMGTKIVYNNSYNEYIDDIYFAYPCFKENNIDKTDKIKPSY